MLYMLDAIGRSLGIYERWSDPSRFNGIRIIKLQGGNITKYYIKSQVSAGRRLRTILGADDRIVLFDLVFDVLLRIP